MADRKGMFTELMDASREEPKPPPGAKEPVAPPAKAKLEPTVPSPDGHLPPRLDDLSERGYTSHSYRFTADESHWIKWFCLQMSARLGRTIHHNTLMRALLRIAAEESTSDPERNRLLKILSKLRD